jgi:hypothetical protein
LERTILEEEEKVEDDDQNSSEEEAKFPVQNFNKPLTKDRAQKIAERDIYLRRPPNQTVTLIKSTFAGRDPYIFFPYPPYLNIQRPLP